MKSLYWLRSDLRIRDNEALLACLKLGGESVVVFAETASLKRAEHFRRFFINESLLEFKNKVEHLGLQFIQTELSFSDWLNAEPRAFDSLLFTREHAWEERLEEARVEELCQQWGTQVLAFHQGTLVSQTDLPFAVADMPFVFTEFRKKIEATLKVRPLLTQPALSLSQSSTTNVQRPLTGGEDQGLARLEHYLWNSDAVQTYKETRNGMIQFDDSSKFSPWLATGCLSARTVYHELKRYESEVCENESTYWLFFELLWRDYFKFFSVKFGKKIFLRSGVSPGRSQMVRDPALFNSWCEGATQDVFVNANMEELNQTGWMSNRGRQNVASYLIHDLGLDWTWGAAYFEKKLIDYDPDSNWGNWLYLSGRGSDPRARKFNTAKQAETYDPLGEYRKKWHRDFK